ncbi:hypothetical protein [Paraburkholderia silvatlantica]|uniref:hypothetical protein n=1 Tax=Paraburkholderia silvatlantica TaxID=321895 RepID=UPI003750E152
MQKEVGYRADPKAEPASQLRDAWQTFFTRAPREMGCLFLPTVKTRGEAVRSLMDAIEVGGDVTTSPWPQTVRLLHAAVDIKSLNQPHFPHPAPHNDILIICRALAQMGAMRQQNAALHRAPFWVRECLVVDGVVQRPVRGPTTRL